MKSIKFLDGDFFPFQSPECEALVANRKGEERAVPKHKFTPRKPRSPFRQPRSRDTRLSDAIHTFLRSPK